MTKARAEIEISANASRLTAGLNAARSKFAGFQSSIARGTGTAMRNVFKDLTGDFGRRAAGNFGGDMLGRGFDALVGAAGDVREFESNLNRLQIATNQTPEQMDKMRQAIRAVSNETAVGSSEILAATQNYVDLTGDVAGSTSMMRTFARVSQASGASMSDVSGAAAALGDALKISPEEMEATFSGLITQGKAGAVSLKDFAAELSSLAPKFARFQGSMGRGGALQLGAAFQVARKGFGSASEAATGLEAMMGALSTNAAKFEKSGVRVFDVHKDGTKTFRNLRDIVGDIGKSNLAKDPTLLTKAFGSKEAEGTYNQLNRLAPLYDQISVAGENTTAVQVDLAARMDSSAGRIDKAFNEIKVSLAEAFTPERIEAVIKAVSSLAEGLSKVIGVIGAVTDKLAALGENEYFQQFVGQGSNVAMTKSIAAARDRAESAQLTKETEGLSFDRHDPAVMEQRRKLGWTEDEVLTGERRRSIAGSVVPTEAMRAESDAARLELAARIQLKAAQAMEQTMTALYGVQPKTTVNIDGNPVATAVDKATNARTRPEGR